MEGIINLDKPAGISSAAAVAKVKWLLPRGMKIGHAGTLDPFATGVLVLLVGKATRLSEMIMSQPKQYEATLKLGATTSTFDRTEAEVPTPGAAAVTLDAIRGALPQFIGAIQQVPPAFSALWVGGQRAYKLARHGAAPELPPRTVQVYGIELLDFDWPLLRLRIDCGRGTYIRAIARDLGEVLGVGAYLTELRRTRVGDCKVQDAVTLATLGSEGVEKHLQAWKADIR